MSIKGKDIDEYNWNPFFIRVFPIIIYLYFHVLWIVLIDFFVGYRPSWSKSVSSALVCSSAPHSLSSSPKACTLCTPIKCTPRSTPPAQPVTAAAAAGAVLASMRTTSGRRSSRTTPRAQPALPSLPPFPGRLQCGRSRRLRWLWRRAERAPRRHWLVPSRRATAGARLAVRTGARDTLWRMCTSWSAWCCCLALSLCWLSTNWWASPGASVSLTRVIFSLCIHSGLCILLKDKLFLCRGFCGSIPRVFRWMREKPSLKGYSMSRSVTLVYLIIWYVVVNMFGPL